MKMFLLTDALKEEDDFNSSTVKTYPNSMYTPKTLTYITGKLIAIRHVVLILQGFN